MGIRIKSKMTTLLDILHVVVSWKTLLVPIPQVFHLMVMSDNANKTSLATQWGLLLSTHAEGPAAVYVRLFFF